MNQKKWLLPVLVAQAIIVFLIGFMQIDSEFSLIKMFSELYTPIQLIFGFIALEIFLILGIAETLKEKQIIRDEREIMIELKSYKATYISLSMMSGMFLLLDLYVTRSNLSLKPAQVVLWFSIFASMLNFLFTKFYRKYL